MVAFVNKSRESQSFGSAPVDSGLLSDRVVAILENLNDIVVEFAISGEDRDLLTNFVQKSLLNSSHSGEIIILNFSPLLGHPVFLSDLKIFALSVCLFHLCTA
jgi:hypothetical protein